MANYQISGELIIKHATSQVSDAFKKRDFVILQKSESVHGTFLEFISFSLFQSKCNLLDLAQCGNNYNVSFNIRGKKFEKEGKTSFFNSLEAWAIAPIDPPFSQPPNVYHPPPSLSTPVVSPAEYVNLDNAPSLEKDDIPF